MHFKCTPRFEKLPNCSTNCVLNSAWCEGADVGRCEGADVGRCEGADVGRCDGAV